MGNCNTRIINGKNSITKINNMKIGDIDVTNSILNLEHDLNILQQFLDKLIQNNPGLSYPSKQEIEVFQKNALQMLEKKYPTMGIKKN